MALRFAGLRFQGFPQGRPRGRARRRAVPPWPALERLEDRTLLSASLSLYNGSYSGTYSGTSTVNNNGATTTSTVSPSVTKAAIANGHIAVTNADGSTGAGTIDSQGNVSGTVNYVVQGQALAVQFTGKVTAVNGAATILAGTWSYSKDLGGGVVVSGSGSWSSSSAEVVTDFDGNYAGSYQGSTVLNYNGAKTNSTVANSPYTAVISNGAITVNFPPSSGLSTGHGTIDASGKIAGKTSFVTNGVTVTVNFAGNATRSLSGVQMTGTWNFSQNFGPGIVYTGQGTWSAKNVLSFDGSYAGTYDGNVAVNNNGSTTTTPVSSLVSDRSSQLTISNGLVSVTVPGIQGTGTGTIDSDGNIVGTVTYQDNGATVTVQFSGKAIQTVSGTVITGTWSYTENYGNGVVETGSGTWTANNTTPV